MIRSLAERIWRTSYAAMLSTAQIDYMLAWMYDPAKIAAELAAGGVWRIAAVEGVPSGYLSLTFHDPDSAELNKLYLLPELQGRGFGQILLSEAIRRAEVRGCTMLRLRVNKTNARALRAYRRAGFGVVDELVANIGGGFVMDDYVLARAIGQGGAMQPHTSANQRS